MTYKITVLGKPLQIRSDLAPDVLERIVEDVERRAQEIFNLTQETNRTALFILVALNLALELHEVRQNYEDLARRAAALLDEVQSVLAEPGPPPILANHPYPEP